MERRKLRTWEAATAAGIALSTLNEWITLKKLRAPRPTLVGAVGMRLWSPRDVERIRKVKAATYRKGRGRKKGTQVAK